MAEFLNVWKSTEQKPVYCQLDQKLYFMGDWAIYRENKESHFYTYKNIAIGNTVGFSTEMLSALANNKRPDLIQSGYMFARMTECKERGEKYLSKQQTV